MTLKDTLLVIFDTSPSRHKDGIFEILSRRYQLILVHLELFNPNPTHPSAALSDLELGRYRRLYIYPDQRGFVNSLNFIKTCIDNTPCKTVVFCFSFLAVKPLLSSLFIAFNASKSGKILKYILHLEPLRVWDSLILLRLCRYLIVATLLNLFVPISRLYTTSTLNSCLYSFLFKHVKIARYRAHSSILPKLTLSKKKYFHSHHSLGIIFVGQLINRKNPMLILKAAENLNFPFTLSFYGKGPLDQSLKDMVLANKMSDFTFFHGHKNLEEIKCALSMADVLILPSRFDGYGFVVREALSLGLFIIVSSRVGAKDLLLNRSDRGVVLDTFETDKLALSLSYHYYSRISYN